MLDRNLRTKVLKSDLGPWLRQAYATHRDRALQRSLAGRLRSQVVIDAVGRATTGRPASRPERTALRAQAVGGASITEIAAQFRRSPDGTAHTQREAAQALRSSLEQRWAYGEQIGSPLVFLHTMKVGGTSLGQLAANAVGPGGAVLDLFLDELVTTPAVRLAAADFVAGHLPYSALTLLPKGSQSMTVLRDPIERSLSHYRHLLRVDRLTSALDGELTLERFAFSDEFAIVAGNYQARHLAHEIDLDGAWVRYSPPQRHQLLGGRPGEPYPLQSLFDMEAVGMSSNELYALARDNLDQVDHVGTTERLDDLGAYLADRFNAQAAAVPRLNVSPPMARDELSDRIWKRLDERTQIDRALYDEAVRRSQTLTAAAR